MNMQWNEIFKLPESALTGGVKIDKKRLAQDAPLTKNDRKTLQKVKQLDHFATVNKSTTRIPPYVDDERNMQRVIFLRCEMADSSKAVAEVAHLLHGRFPNPTIIMQEAGEQICISVATTRKSRSEQGAVVVDRIESTGLFSKGNAPHEPLLESLAFDRLPQDDLWIYLSEIADNVSLSSAIGLLGFFPQTNSWERETLMGLTADLKKVQSSLKQLDIQHKDRTLPLNETAKIRGLMKKTKQEQAALADKIKEICHE